MNQLYVCVYPFPLELPSHPAPHPTLLGPQGNQAEFPVLYNSSH